MAILSIRHKPCGFGWVILDQSKRQRRYPKPKDKLWSILLAPLMSIMFGLMFHQYSRWCRDLTKQENVLQLFKLPRPILGIGGVLQLELLGRVQRQEMDDLYYFCMCYVRVIGRPLSPILDVDLSDSSGKPVLKFLPAAMQSALLEQQSTDPTGPSSEPSPTARNNPSPAVGGWILNALLGTGLVADESDDSSDEENWYI